MACMTLEDLNAQTPETFTAHLGRIFEHSPWVPETVAAQRPFSSVTVLHAAMVQAVAAAGPARQLELICAHPDLGSRLRMSDESVGEQAGVGLDRLTPALFERFSSLNTQYRARFGFPFIVAVRNHTRDSILKAFETRLHHDANTERDTALREIAEIARFRLFDLLDG
jgi:2-oxo-4-hydroxy-4-carboxy-5-ureidoimidazoline decarboxylase